MSEDLSIIVSADESGGTHTSRTMMLKELTDVLDSTPASSSIEDIKAAIIDHNVVGKNTLSGRQRAYRYLRELYALDARQLSFRALRDLWDRAPQGRPLLALLSALARDPLLRATAPTVINAPVGTHLGPADLATAVQAEYPNAYSDAVAAKIGRNAASSWTQSGHLVGRSDKKRARVEPTPESVAYALLIGYSEGRRGEMLFGTTWTDVLDRPKDALMELAHRASQRGLIEFKHGGGVTEVNFKLLLRPFEGEADE